MEIPLVKWVVKEDEKSGNEALEFKFTNSLDVDVKMINSKNNQDSNSGAFCRYKRTQIEALIKDLSEMLEKMP